jgi:hypothetical protein
MVEAPSSDRLVHVKRKGLDSFRGITAAVGLKWIAFHLIHDLEILSLTAVRRSEISSMKYVDTSDSVVVRSLRNRNVFPREEIGLRLDTTADALESLTELTPLITIHPERRRPGVCNLGLVCSMDRVAKKFDFLHVDPAAVWDLEPTSWRFRDVRRIEVRDLYGAAIFDLAGDPAANRTST